MKIREERKGESLKLKLAFGIASVIALIVVHSYAFAGKDPNAKFIQALDDKNVQYVITDGQMYVIDDSDPAEICKLAKKSGSNVKSVYNSKTIKKARCK